MYTLHDVGDQALGELEKERRKGGTGGGGGGAGGLGWSGGSPGSENSSPPTVPWSSTMTLSPQIWTS